jgi:hypothetical protein
VCFLERDFPIPIHGPVIAREVLSCGTCLVLSGEIHAKQPNGDELADGDSIVLIPDPKDRETLAKRLRTLIEDPALATAIGARGYGCRTGFPDFGTFVAAWEDLVTGAGVRGLGHSGGVLADRLAETLPWARPLLGDSFDELVGCYADEAGGLLATADADDPALARGFCELAADRLDGALRDVARYEAARLRAIRDDDAEPPAPPVTNALSGRAPTAAAMRLLYPYRCVPVRIERFGYDVTTVLCHSAEPDVSDPDDIPPRPLVIGFARMPNLSPTELRLNDATVRLLAACSGGSRADQLVTGLTAASGSDQSDQTVLERQAFGVLAQMYVAGIIGFATAPAPAAAMCYAA